MICMILVNNPGDWGNVYPLLLHAEWHGCTLADLVFPFFVLAMGMALPLSGESRQKLDFLNFQKILSRALRLICLGLFLAFFSRIEFGQEQGITLMLFRLMITGFVGFLLLGNFPTTIKFYSSLVIFIVMLLLIFSGIPKFEEMRIPGVLQRLGLVYFLAAIIFYAFSFRVQFIIAAFLLVGYWLLLAYVPLPGTETTGFEKGINWPAWVDTILLKGHVWSSSKPWDPEGILSTFPAVISCLIGAWAGLLIKLKTDIKTVGFVGVALLMCGLIWSNYFPLNKMLWSSSFVLFTAGFAILIVSFLSFFFDGKKPNAVISFLTMWGKNPIIVFFGAGIIPRALNMIKIDGVSILQSFYVNRLSPIFENPMNSSLAYAILNIVFWSLVLVYLRKQNMIIKV